MRAASSSPRLIWTVLCAVWLAALAPSVSALLASQGRSWVEVCTSAGAQWRPLDAGRQGDDHPLAAAHRHCPYCLLQHDLALPPAGLAPSLMAQALPACHHWHAHPRPALTVAWARLPSRAPPAHAFA